MNTKKKLLITITKRYLSIIGQWHGKLRRQQISRLSSSRWRAGSRRRGRRLAPVRWARSCAWAPCPPAGRCLGRSFEALKIRGRGGGRFSRNQPTYHFFIRIQFFYKICTLFLKIYGRFFLRNTLRSGKYLGQFPAIPAQLRQSSVKHRRKVTD